MVIDISCGASAHLRPKRLLATDGTDFYPEPPLVDTYNGIPKITLKCKCGASHSFKWPKVIRVASTLPSHPITSGQLKSRFQGQDVVELVTGVDI